MSEAAIETGAGRRGVTAGLRRASDIAIRSLVPLMLALLAGGVLLAVLGRNPFSFYGNVWTFAGKGGSLVLRERTEAIDLGQDLDHNAFSDGIGIGTWKVVRGTGNYAGIAGGGRSAHFFQGHRWVARFEGFLTS